MIFETPQTMPWLNQLVITRSQAPAPNSSSPSLDMMPRAAVRRCFRARISAQIIAIGVRESVLPPMPTTSPSFTSFAASSRVVTFSCRLRSRATVLRRSSRYPSVTPLPVPCLARPIDAGLGVELLDQLIPARNRRLQPVPEALIASPVEIRERYALLLDPGVIAEIEDALALDLRQLEHVIVGDGREMRAEDLARVELAEAAGIARRRILVALAPVHGGTIGCDRDDRVLAAEFEALRRLDRRQHVRDAREAETIEARHQRGIDMPARRDILPPNLAVEQKIERVGAAIRDTHDDVAIEDVVNEGDVLVADALDVVLAVTVHEHGRAFDGLDRDDLGAELGLEIVPRAECPRRARCRDEGREPH